MRIFINTLFIYLIYALVGSSPGFAFGADTYLPLAPGNSWELSIGAVTTKLSVNSFSTVNGVSRAKIFFDNPWSPFTFLVRNTSAGTLLEGIEYPLGRNGYPDPVIMFGQGAPGTKWTSPNLTATLVSNSESVVTPYATYSNVLRYDISLNGSLQTWYLAPNVGFVQFGAGNGLKLSNLTLNAVPATVAPVAASCPYVGVTANPSANGDFSARGKEQALQKAIAAGSNFMTIVASWAQLEPSPGSFDFSSISDQVALALKYNVNAVLTIKTIDTLSRPIPSDLLTLQWDAPPLTSRWQGLLRALVRTLNARVKWINLGNEVDTYLTVHPADMTPYSAFLQTGRTTVEAIDSSISTGVVFGFDSWHMNDSSFRALYPQLRHVSFTYYDANSTVPGTVQRDPADVSFDMADMLSAVNGKRLILTEVGYTSSTAVGSSTSAQQAFYVNTLLAFSKAGNRLLGATYSFMSDFPAATLAQLSAAYGPSGAGWVLWLGNLGLVDNMGIAKPAWNAFRGGAIPMRNNAGCTRS